MTLDFRPHLQLELRYAASDRAEEFVQFGASDRLTNASMSAIAKDQMQP
jgi:hypothetical protein